MARTRVRRVQHPNPTQQRSSLQAGSLVGRWTLTARLGRGGNGEVWSASDRDEVVAIKFLSNVNGNRYARFHAEISALLAARDVVGVLPILDHHLPNPSSAGPTPIPWYAMPVATASTEALRSRDPRMVISAVASWATTLAELHSRGISHRDIKPPNLYFRNGQWLIGDFGLVRLPVAQRVTQMRESVGPRWTIAPEMRRLAARADGAPADVYSLAKTLWILLTGNPLGFEGQYVPGGTVSLDRRLLEIDALHAIEDLLVSATDNDPRLRPLASEFANTLRNWLNNSQEFHARSLADWRYALGRMPRVAGPSRIIWESPPQIAAILNECGRMPNSNHMFYPSGGGNDLEGATLAAEPDCVALLTGGTPSIVRPRRLILELFEGHPEWSYLRLENDGLREIVASNDSDDDGVDGSANSESSEREARRLSRTNRHIPQEMVELTPGEYGPASLWDAGCVGWDDNGDPIPLPTGARRVLRYLTGDFVVFGKSTPYNLDSKTYDARHARMSTDSFRAYILRQLSEF